MVPFPVNPRVPTPSDSTVGVPSAPQYQTDSTPQPSVGLPNAASAPGGTRSHVGSGEADNRPHNDSHQPGL